MITFLSKEFYIEESAGKREIYLIMEEKIREYERRMLCDSDCPFTLPMHFISDEDTIKVYYNFTGYTQLEEYINRKPKTDISDRESQKKIFDSLDVLTKILESLKGMESYLLFTERISIHQDLIFINSDDGRVAFAFFPNENDDKTLPCRVIEIANAINSLYADDETAQFLEKFKDYIQMKNPGLDGMISYLGILQREISYIFWNVKNFRRAEQIESIDVREHADNTLTTVIKNPAPLKIIMIQVIIGAALFIIFLCGMLEIENFAGLIIVAAAVDLLIVRMIRLKEAAGYLRNGKIRVNQRLAD